MGLRSAYCSAAPRHMPNSIRLRRQTGLCLFVRHHVGRPTTVVAEISLRSHPLRSAGMLTALWHVGTYRPQRQFPQSSDTFHYSTFHTVSVRGLVTTDETRRNCLQIFWTSSAGKFSVELSSRTQLRPSTRRDGLVASRCSWRCELTATASYLHSSYNCLKPRSQRMNRTRLKSAAAVRGEQTGVCELRVQRFIWTQLFSTGVQFSSCAVNDALDALDAE